MEARENEKREAMAAATGVERAQGQVRERVWRGRLEAGWRKYRLFYYAKAFSAVGSFWLRAVAPSIESEAAVVAAAGYSLV